MMRPTPRPTTRPTSRPATRRPPRPPTPPPSRSPRSARRDERAVEADPPQPHVDADALVVRVQRIALRPRQSERREAVDVLADRREPPAVARAELEVRGRHDVLAEGRDDRATQPPPRLAAPGRDRRRIGAVPHLEHDLV